MRWFTVGGFCAALLLELVAADVSLANPGAGCHISNGDYPAIEVKTSTDRGQVSEPVEVNWELTSEWKASCKNPLYLIFSLPEWVRLEGQAFIALTPQAEGPFAIKYDLDRLRVLYPYTYRRSRGGQAFGSVRTKRVISTSNGLSAKSSISGRRYPLGLGFT
jgi:hypothetical protein